VHALSAGWCAHLCLEPVCFTCLQTTTVRNAWTNKSNAAHEEFPGVTPTALSSWALINYEARIIHWKQDTCFITLCSKAWAIVVCVGACACVYMCVHVRALCTWMHLNVCIQHTFLRWFLADEFGKFGSTCTRICVHMLARAHVNCAHALMCWSASSGAHVIGACFSALHWESYFFLLCLHLLDSLNAPALLIASQSCNECCVTNCPDVGASIAIFLQSTRQWLSPGWLDMLVAIQRVVC